MGAANALAAYATWGGKVPPLSLNLLVYMALRSVDGGEHLRFGLGHAHLAEHALGRPIPIGRSDIKAVERAITPLLRAGALSSIQRGAVRVDGDSCAIYRLYFHNAAAADVPIRQLGPRDGVTVLYRWFDAVGVLLYIGITNDTAIRFEQHAKHSTWFRYAAEVTIWIYPNRAAAERAEKSAIENERPMFNLDHNDAVPRSKRDAYIRATLALAEAVAP